MVIGKLETIVFGSGAVVMILELVGSRLLAPFLGTTLVVWTSLIGIILGSLSLGYWYGGKLADRNARWDTLSRLLLIGGILVSSIVFIKPVILPGLQTASWDIRFSAVMATLILFAPASVLLGMISPYAVRLKLEDLKRSGQTIGNLYAISTIGSIVGTFLAGFVFISLFSTTTILWLLALILGLLALLADRTTDFWLKTLFLLGTVVYLFKLIPVPTVHAGYYETETLYNTVLITNDEIFQKTGERHMILNAAFSSAIPYEGNDLVYDYTKYYRLSQHFNPDINKGLLIGGAGFTYPKDFLKQFPNAAMEVVEIDPQLLDLAKQYMRFQDDPRLTVVFDDARIYLEKTSTQYDVIFGDAYNHYSVPPHLTTLEIAQTMFDHLSNNGVVLLNLISNLDGTFLKAEYSTFKRIFPQVYLFATVDPKNSRIPQNVQLVALKSKQVPSWNSQSPELQNYLANRITLDPEPTEPILTDEFAPVEQYMVEVLKLR